MGFFDKTKLLLSVRADLNLTEAGMALNIKVEGHPVLVEIVEGLLSREPEPEPSFEDILAAAMRGDSGPMESSTFEDALAAAMGGTRRRGATVVDLSSFMAEVMAGDSAGTEFPDYQEVFAAYMADEYLTENELVNQGAMAIALVQEEELPEDVVVPPAVSRIASRYLQGVRDCHCGNPSCRAHFLFKVIEAFEAQYGEDETDGQDDDGDDQLDAEAAADAANVGAGA